MGVGGTTQIEGSGAKPRIMGFEKYVGGVVMLATFGGRI